MDNNFFENSYSTDPTDRVDGKQKVTGAARYAAEYALPGMTYAVFADSTIAKGTIKTLDTKSAEKAPGVLAVITYLNAPKVPGYESNEGDAGPSGLKIFHSNRIYFDGQPIALVVADTYERALHAASLVTATYEKEAHQTDLSTQLDKAVLPKSPRFADYTRGDAEAWKSAPVTVEEAYEVPMEVHLPMEMGSTTAVWEGEDQLTVYDKTQGVMSTRGTLANLFKIPAENVRVIAPFVGGGFGMALRTWPYVVATVMAAKKVGKPVKLMLKRSEMFTQVGYRPNTIQKIGLGATADGKLTGIFHEATSLTSSFEEFTEGTVGATKFLYASPNVHTRYRIVPLDINTPTWMRGPGEATGLFALESALDELAYKLNLDPIELRLRNYPEIDPQRELPWSSNFIKDCYEKGAERIGWFQRNREPRSMREGNLLVGYGMSVGVFHAFRWNATARAQFFADGRVLIQSAASDIGPGTGTAMVLIAAKALGVPAERITFELGDSALPPAPTQGGSGTLSAVGSAVHDVCTALKARLLELASASENSPFKGATEANLRFENAEISMANSAVKIAYTDILKQNNLPEIDLTRESRGGQEQQKYSMYSYAVHFVKVQVHPETGVIRVSRVVTTADAGTIVSEKTAESQMIGGVVGGIGMALMEEGVIDHRYGRYVNNNFADYHIPANADVPDTEVIFINKPDPYINPMGAKGMGEVALIGFAAAVANAVYHATGKRVRELPITLDRVV